MTTRLSTITVLICLLTSGIANAAEPGFELKSDIVYGEVGGVKLLVDVYLPKQNKPTAKTPGVLVVHGGAWRSGSKRQLSGYAMQLARHGYAAFAINYRLAPKHQFPAQIDDCRTAVRWIKKHAAGYNVDPQRLGGIGYSAGGHLLTLLACTATDKTHRDTALICVAAGGAPCDFRETPLKSRFMSFWLKGTRAEHPELYKAASPAAFVSKDVCPIFFFHGTKDRLVSVDSPRKMVAALKKSGAQAELRLINSAGHIAAALDRRALEDALGFFDAKLKKAADKK